MLLHRNSNILIIKDKKKSFFFWKETEAKLQKTKFQKKAFFLEAKLQKTKFIMRTIINQQKQLGEVEIASLQFDPKSRDDIPQILRGLQHIYTPTS